MKQITVVRNISMGHRLPSYIGLCSSLHGHNVRFEVTIAVTEDFLDFKKVDEALSALTSEMDHAMVLYAQDPWLEQILVLNTRVVKLSVEPTTEALAQYIFNEMTKIYAHVERVTVYETDKYSASCNAVDFLNIWRRSDGPMTYKVTQ